MKVATSSAVTSIKVATPTKEELITRSDADKIAELIAKGDYNSKLVQRFDHAITLSMQANLIYDIHYKPS